MPIKFAQSAGNPVNLRRIKAARSLAAQALTDAATTLVRVGRTLR